MSDYDVDLENQIRNELQEEAYYYHDEIKKTIQWLKDRIRELQIDIDQDLVDTLVKNEKSLFESFEEIIEVLDKKGGEE